MANEGIEYAREWLTKATNDRRSAEALIELSEPLTDTAAFHCQQAVEKLLKGFLVYHNAPFEKIHDLTHLCALCVGIDDGFVEFGEQVGSLTRYAVRFRYPGFENPSVADVREALALMDRCWSFVLGKLPKGATTGL